ncbi:malto-oligosyltrehalose trehalohydrolase [Desulfotomaculum copahuensis]|uniref:Malto-oligosyltrehalose trehalohydrolase n=2 Tax=Desulfotomaculum copahuensis TaxID=1838280 RepID=A0A1B7LCX8_9FIRM|nr:malto-oligosyltrehalose trehalohydrolase [Desulfotomaculum copahuensis]
MDANPATGECPGAVYLGDGRCRFLVWAPLAGQVNVRIVSPRERILNLKRQKRGYHRGVFEDIEPGSLYFYLLDKEKERPDPASRHQPEGVHGPSRVVDTGAYAWTDQCWPGPSRRDLALYELHVGTFTPEGTFDAVTAQLDELKALGINTLEIMPVAQFPGSRNWGYDGVYPYAVQHSYGGPEGLQRLVNACHGKGLAVILDVVYNHLGPEGNYLADFGPYFTNRYTGPWGAAVNFDGPGSDEVRRFFIQNALYWLTGFHLDGFRVDAVHAIKDFSARPFLEELNSAVHRRGERLGKRVYMLAESDLNDPRVILPPVMGGYGFDAQWTDDFHHALHTLLTGERDGYYHDFGGLRHLARAFGRGYVYTGQYSEYRQRRHGRSPRICPARQFVVFAQNHDQVGNRACGERLAALTSFDGLKLAACTVILSPFVPLIFMGEEYGETAPFQYFTSHPDPRLAAAVSKGRRQEFAAFGWEGAVPDPQDENTFLRSRLNYGLRSRHPNRVLYALYRQLLQLRRELPALADPDRENMEVLGLEPENVLFIRRWSGADQACLVLSFNRTGTAVTLPVPAGRWRKLLDTADERWLGKGSTTPTEFSSPGKMEVILEPETCVLFQKLKED